MCIVTCEWQDESTCMTICVWVYLLTQCISNCQCIWADSASVEWAIAIQASSVHVPTNWGCDGSQSKNFFNWSSTRLDSSSPDWSIAGMVESLNFTTIYLSVASWGPPVFGFVGCYSYSVSEGGFAGLV
jgi:hypothetical protein